MTNISIKSLDAIYGVNRTTHHLHTYVHTHAYINRYMHIYTTYISHLNILQFTIVLEMTHNM